MPVEIDLQNKRIGLLTVVRRAARKNNRTRWVVKCDCGTIKEVGTSTLNHINPRWRTKSCGCVNRKKAGDRFRTHGMANTIELNLFNGAKRRAKNNGLEFNIELSDIQVPLVCPLLEIPIFKAGKRITPNSPSLDRRNTKEGYVKGNVWVVSYRANSIKSDCTINELELLIQNLKK